MITTHAEHAGPRGRRPAFLPKLTPEDFVKGKYQEGDKFCYTGWLLHIFIPNSPHRHDYVHAYREFRLATMDRMYATTEKDRCETAEQRCDAFNSVAIQLGYVQVKTDLWLDQYSEPLPSNQ